MTNFAPLFKSPANYLLEDCSSILSLRGKLIPDPRDNKSKIPPMAFAAIAGLEREIGKYTTFRIRDNIDLTLREVRHARSQTISNKWKDLLETLKLGFTPAEMNTHISSFCDKYLDAKTMTRLEDMADSLNHERHVIERCIAREDLEDCLADLMEIVDKLDTPGHITGEIKDKILELHNMLQQAGNHGLREFWPKFGNVDDQITNAIYGQPPEVRETLFLKLRKSKFLRAMCSPYAIIPAISLSADAMQIHSYVVSELPAQLGITLKTETVTAIDGAIAMISGIGGAPARRLFIPAELDALKLLPNRSSSET
jgi:hypothetical protein